jgi:hypothetical protein
MPVPIRIALMMEAVNNSETSVDFYVTTRRKIPEESHAPATLDLIPNRSREIFICSSAFMSAPKPTQPPVQWGPSTLVPGRKSVEVWRWLLTASTVKVRMRGAVPRLLLWHLKTSRVLELGLVHSRYERGVGSFLFQAVIKRRMFCFPLSHKQRTFSKSASSKLWHCLRWEPNREGEDENGMDGKLLLSSYCDLLNNVLLYESKPMFLLREYNTGSSLFAPSIPPWRAHTSRTPSLGEQNALTSCHKIATGFFRRCHQITLLKVTAKSYTVATGTVETRRVDTARNSHPSRASNTVLCT